MASSTFLRLPTPSGVAAARTPSPSPSFSEDLCAHVASLTFPVSSNDSALESPAPSFPSSATTLVSSSMSPGSSTSSGSAFSGAGAGAGAAGARFTFSVAPALNIPPAVPESPTSSAPESPSSSSSLAYSSSSSSSQGPDPRSPAVAAALRSAYASAAAYVPFELQTLLAAQGAPIPFYGRITHVESGRQTEWRDVHLTMERVDTPGTGDAPLFSVNGCGVSVPLTHAEDAAASRFLLFGTFRPHINAGIVHKLPYALPDAAGPESQCDAPMIAPVSTEAGCAAERVADPFAAPAMEYHISLLPMAPGSRTLRLYLFSDGEVGYLAAHVDPARLPAAVRGAWEAAGCRDEDLLEEEGEDEEVFHLDEGAEEGAEAAEVEMPESERLPEALENHDQGQAGNREGAVIKSPAASTSSSSGVQPLAPPAQPFSPRSAAAATAIKPAAAAASAAAAAAAVVAVASPVFYSQEQEGDVAHAAA